MGQTVGVEASETGASRAPFPSPQAWRESGEYLPDFMRDFHDQKDLFKALQDVVERSNAKHGGPRMLGATWADYHVYTVDIFLWVMANHGYTLQRSRKRLLFADVWDFVGAAKARWQAQYTSILKQGFAGSSASEPTDGKSRADPNPLPNNLGDGR